MTVDEMKSKLMGVDIQRIAAISLRDRSDTFIDQQKEQLFSGKKSDGSDVTPSYAPATIKIKKKKGQPTDRVTEKDTGDFYDGIFLDVGIDTYRVFSNDYKAPLLEAKYTDGIWGLNNTSRLKFLPILQQTFVNNFKRAAGI